MVCYSEETENGSGTLYTIDSSALRQQRVIFFVDKH